MLDDLIGWRAEHTEGDVKVSHWYWYGDRVKYVGLFSSPGASGRDNGDCDIATIIGDYRDSTGKVDFSVERHIPLEPGVFSNASGGDDGGGDDAKTRFGQSIRRARSMVEQYACCNPWAYFVTLTLDGDKAQRDDLDAFAAHFRQLCKDIRKATGESVSYVLVPELHLDGENWHMHGLLNIPDKELIPVESVSQQYFDGVKGYVDNTGRRVPLKLVIAHLEGRKLYRFPRYERNFGFCSVEKVESPYGAAGYCSKMFRYMYKSMDTDSPPDDKSTIPKHKAAWEVLGAGKHLYYASRGLLKREKIAPCDATNITRDMKPGKLYIYDKCVICWYTQNEL